MKNNEENVPLIDGGAVKSLGGGRYGGFGVPFGGAPDCVLDVFDPGMTLEDLGLDDGRKTIPILFAHNQDKVVGKRRLADATFEHRPGEGLWVEWVFKNSFDPVIANIRQLADEGSMALSSGSIPHMVQREPQGDYYLIKVWPVAEISLTGSACCLSGQTKVETLKDFDGLSLEEIMRRRGMDENQLRRVQSEDLHYQSLKLLGLTGSDEAWMDRQRAKRVKSCKDRQRRQIDLTAETARKELDKARDLLREVEAHAKQVDDERARLGLGPGIPYRHFEDWIHAGERSGFISPGRGMRW